MTGKVDLVSKLVDLHNRHIYYMRLSLTDRCNFRCVYCMPEKGTKFIPHEEILSFEELLRVCRIAVGLGITHYKITGGEALCRKGSLDFIEKLSGLKGVRQVTLTTNGSLFLPALSRLVDCGVSCINVSLDALSQEAFERITRCQMQVASILQTIEEMKKRGIKVKINTVPMQNYNENEIIPLAKYALQNEIPLRYIELMPIGEGKDFLGISLKKIQNLLKKEFGTVKPSMEKFGNGPAQYFYVQNFSTPLGYIAALSNGFCGDCNRIRFTSWGFLKACLHHNIGTDIKKLLRNGTSDEEISSVFVKTIQKKPLSHHFKHTAEQDENGLSMYSVGG